MEDLVRSKIGAALGDDSLVEYVAGLLVDAPDKEESGETIVDFLQSAGSLDEEAAREASEQLFTALQSAGFGTAKAGENDDNNNDDGGKSDASTSTSLLTKKVVMAAQDETSAWASGNAAGGGKSVLEAGLAAEKEQQSAMVVDAWGAGDPLRATNQRALRKAAQERKRLLREMQMAEEARDLEARIAHELSNATGVSKRSSGDGRDESPDDDDDDDDDVESGSGVAGRDVHFRNFDLENKKGSGLLLTKADLTLSAGRRYGLIGRNGCGKTTLLELVASRDPQVKPGVPRRMPMLLVKQEIVGTDATALETVLRSDAKREALTRSIARLEKEDSDDKEAAASGGDPQQHQQEEGKEIAKKKKKSGSSSGKQKETKKREAAGEHDTGSDTRTASTAARLEERRQSRALQLSKFYERLAEHDDARDGAPGPRARKVLSGLGFSEAMLERPTRMLSGGWRMRVSLACALFSAPQLLLLDEPTNHLDLEAVLWLDHYLTSGEFKGTLLVVSHDRHFLNSVVTDVVAFDQQKQSLKVYKGDVTNYEAVRADEKLRQQRLFDQQEARRAHLQKYIDEHAKAGENGPKAAAQRKSRMKKMERLGVEAAGGDGRRYKASYDTPAEEVEKVAEEAEVVLDFPDPGVFDKPIVTLEDVSFAYEAQPLRRSNNDDGDTELDDDVDMNEDYRPVGAVIGDGSSSRKPPTAPSAADMQQASPLLRNVEMQIDCKSRIALLGRNGCGKSTLIKLMVGTLRPNRGGQVKLNGNAKIEYVAQHQLEQLDPMSTPLQTMLSRYPGNGSDARKLELRTYLARFGLGGEVLPHQKILTLSGGQKCRVCLAAAMYRKPHLLILDEPTNHLDLETTDALVKAMKDFKGGIVVVSHDQHLLSTACDELWAVHGGTAQRLNHSFARYRKDVIAGKR